MTFLVLYVVLFSLAQGRETPTFRWASESRNTDGIPDLYVTFIDGTEDFIELHHYTPIELEKGQEAATFMGKLNKEQTSVVAVTGHPYSSDYHVSILRANHNDITVHVNGEGKSTHIERIMGNEFDFVIPIQSVIDKEFNQSTPMNRNIPSENYLRMVCGYTTSAIKQLGSVERFLHWLSQFMTHLQAFYHHPSLQFRVTFDTPVPILDLTSSTAITKASSNTIESLRPITLSNLKQSGNSQHLAVFVYDNSDDETIGIAFLNGICSGRDIQVSVNEVLSSILESAKVTAHELGHNFGVSHDVDPCKGLMYFTTGGGNSWSDCSNIAFQEYYNKMVTQNGYWCLDRSNPAGIGGSWESWGSFDGCTKPCGGGRHSRSRLCIGNNCPGLSSETTDCNTQVCPVCKDIDSQCALRQRYGWCGGSSTDMKRICPQTCNVDLLPTVQCESYKKSGYCTNVNANYMNQHCGATCGYFCS